MAPAGSWLAAAGGGAALISYKRSAPPRRCWTIEVHSRRDDAALWLAGQTDPEAFGELFERHARAVFAFCAHRTRDIALADDLTSVVFLEAWRRRRSVTLTGPSALPWLLGTANNVSRNAQRSLRRHRAALQRLPRGEFAGGFEGETIDRVDAKRAFDLAATAIEALPPGERDVVSLVFWAGLTYEEAAVALEIPVGTVRSRLSRARETLGEALGREPDSGPNADGEAQ
jgi:RNA polymerase sigma-70 factor (ECF subfamily)